MIRVYEFKEEPVKQVIEKNKLLEKKIETFDNMFKSFYNDFNKILHSSDISEIETLNEVYEEELKL